MSRTKHHKEQKNIKLTKDFGSRFNVNKNYSGGVGSTPKKLAHKQMRHEAKQIAREADNE